MIRRFLKLQGWARDRADRGRRRVARTAGSASWRSGGRRCCCRREGVEVELVPIRHDPDEAGLLGGAHLAPSWIFKGHDSILAMDIGGTNARAGLVLLNQKRAPDLSRREVDGLEHWRHADDKPARDEAVERIVGMLQGADQAGGEGGARPGAVHRGRLPGADRRGWAHRARRPEPAGQLGARGLQPAAAAARRSRGSAGTRRMWRCTTTRWCRG